MIITMVCIARILERRWPIATTPLSEVIEDWKVVSVNLALTALSCPAHDCMQWRYLEHARTRLDTSADAWLLVFRFPRNPGGNL